MWIFGRGGGDILATSTRHTECGFSGADVLATSARHIRSDECVYGHEDAMEKSPTSARYEAVTTLTHITSYLVSSHIVIL